MQLPGKKVVLTNTPEFANPNLDIDTPARFNF